MGWSVKVQLPEAPAVAAKVPPQLLPTRVNEGAGLASLMVKVAPPVSVSTALPPPLPVVIVTVCGAMPGPSATVKVKLPSPPIVCLERVKVARPTLVKPQLAAPPAVRVRLAQVEPI